MNIRPVGAEMFHTDGQTDMTKLTVAIRKFQKAPKMVRCSLLTPGTSISRQYISARLSLSLSLLPLSLKEFTHYLLYRFPFHPRLRQWDCTRVWPCNFTSAVVNFRTVTEQPKWKLRYADVLRFVLRRVCGRTLIHYIASRDQMTDEKIMSIYIKNNVAYSYHWGRNLRCSMYRLCVNVYCTTATGGQPNCS